MVWKVTTCLRALCFCWHYRLVTEVTSHTRIIVGGPREGKNICVLNIEKPKYFWHIHSEE